MADVYRGLNLAFRLNDIDNKGEALKNLNLDSRDLDAIRGIRSAGVGFDELKTISGLDVDQKKELYSIGRAAFDINNYLTTLTDINRPQEYNIRIDDQVRASAIKYSFIDWSNPTSTKSADISTSRVSSWSSSDNPSTSTSPIFYGGEVEVVGSTVELTELESVNAPVAKRYPAEVATHLVNLSIGGTTKQFFAMKGIPLVYEGFFRNANLGHRVNKIGDILPVWTVTNNDDSRFYESFNGTNSTVSANDTWTFRDSRARSRTIEFYYNPSNIEKLTLTSLNLSGLSTVSLDNLVEYSLEYNDFYDMPNLAQIAPGLQILNMSGNNLSRSDEVANVQLQRLPTSITDLRINGCFSDSTAIDLTALTQLVRLDMNSYYSSYGARRMTGGTVTPTVSQNTIQSYNVTRQPYTKLSDTVINSTSLVSINIDSNNIDGGETNQIIDFASTNLQAIYSNNNTHNIIPVSNAPKDSIKFYYNQNSRPVTDSTIVGKFNSCTSLEVINLSGTTATGSITNAFSSLPSLRYVDLRWGATEGGLTDASFSGCTSLTHFLVSGSRYNEAEFFQETNGERSKVFYETPNLQYLYVYYNGNISGRLPDLSTNKSLRVLYIRNTSLTGGVPNLNNNTSLYGVYLFNNQFTGAIPQFSGNQFLYIYLNGNSFSGQVPPPVGSNIRRFYVHYNNLTGSVPSFADTPRLEDLYMNNNNLTSYVPGALANNGRLRIADFSNNDLKYGDAINILQDLRDNYFVNPRGSVIVNLLGNADISEAQLRSVEEINDLLNTIEDSFGWTILINA